MGQYSTYLTQIRTLLHDPQANAWTTATLQNFMNEARRRIAKDTWCLRDLNVGLSLTTGVERYALPAFVTPLPAYAQGIAAVCGVNLYYGNSRYPLTYMPWGQFNLKLRYWSSLQQLPVAWSYIGTNAFYVGPIPDQVYTIDLDVAYIPVDLVSDTQTEQLPLVYLDAVQWWSARLAKMNEQALGEAQFHEAEYFKQIGLDKAGFERFRYNPR